MRLNDVFYDRQSKAGTSGIAGATFVNPVKTVKNVIQVFVLDTDTVITHFNQHKRLAIVKTDLDRKSVV